MQFGLFSHIPWPEGMDAGQILAELTEQVQYGDALGFQSAWFAEHHFSRYSLGSSSLLIRHRRQGPSHIKVFTLCYYSRGKAQWTPHQAMRRVRRQRDNGPGRRNMPNQEEENVS